MISYELAKELKEKGFLQKGEGDWFNEHDCEAGGTYFQQEDNPIHIENDHGVYESVYIPTLSELIEECGDDFGGLIRYEKQWLTIDKKNLDERIGTGIKEDTPEEAVAHLWIALQDK